MNTFSTNTTYEALALLVRSARRVCITTHVKPDGDAMGCVLALSRALRALSIESEIHLIGPVAPNLRATAGPVPLHLVEKSPPGDDFDLIAVLDTGARSQLQPLTDWIATRRDRTIILDHHVQGDDLAALRIIRPECASATQVLVGLLDALGVPLTGGTWGIAEALLMGLATDTGWFRFDNADADCFRFAARLIEAGADKSRLYAMIEENDRPQRFALKSRALASLELIERGQGAIMVLRPEDFHATGGTTEELTGLVNEPMSIATVRVAALVTSTDGRITKISLRSKPAVAQGEGVVDVNRMAHAFGGGGHVHAAGARREAPLDPVVHELRLAMALALREP